MKLMNHNKKIILGTIILLAILILYLALYNSFSLADIQRHAATLQNQINAHPQFAIVCYLALFILATFLYLPVTVILCVAGGFFFGVWPATLYALLGATIGSVSMFILVRYILGNYVQKKYRDQLKAFNKEIEKYGHYYLLMLQFSPFTPTFVINTFAGLTKLSLWTFTWATALGLAPGTFLYTASGEKLLTLSSTRDLLSPYMILLLVGLGILALTPVILRRMNIFPDFTK
jgi:uncharacterized membrane protein YdjX (TVP38/TMEM64 family)